MKEMIVGMMIVALAFYVLIYFPTSWNVKTYCLRKGYPDYAVDRALDGYCIKGTEVIRVK